MADLGLKMFILWSFLRMLLSLSLERRLKGCFAQSLKPATSKLNQLLHEGEPGLIKDYSGQLLLLTKNKFGKSIIHYLTKTLITF